MRTYIWTTTLVVSPLLRLPLQPPPRGARQRYYNRTFFIKFVVITSCVCFLSLRIFPLKFCYIRFSYELVPPKNSVSRNWRFRNCLEVFRCQISPLRPGPSRFCWRWNCFNPICFCRETTNRPNPATPEDTSMLKFTRKCKVKLGVIPVSFLEVCQWRTVSMSLTCLVA